MAAVSADDDEQGERDDEEGSEERVEDKGDELTGAGTKWNMNLSEPHHARFGIDASLLIRPLLSFITSPQLLSS